VCSAALASPGRSSDTNIERREPGNYWNGRSLRRRWLGSAHQAFDASNLAVDLGGVVRFNPERPRRR